VRRAQLRANTGASASSGGGDCPKDHAERLIAAGCSQVFARMADLSVFLGEE